MDALQRVIGSHGGRDILFREIKYERYRKPHVVEYPRNAIVLNPRHTQQQRQQQQQQQNQPGDENGRNAKGSDNDSDDGEDDNSSAGEGSEGDDMGYTNGYQKDQHSGSRSRRKRRVPPKGKHVDDDDPLYLPDEELLCSDEKLTNQFLALQWRHITGSGCGLENAGNTCFANAVLQALAYTPAIAQFLMSYFKAPDPNPSAPHDFGFALAETIRLIHSSSGGDKRRSGRVVRPGRIVGNLRLLSPHFRLGRQSDAHEFAVQLLHACQRSLIYRQQHVLIPGGVGGATGPCRIQPAIQHTSALMRICGGFLRSQVAWSRKDEIVMLRREGKKQSAVDLEMEQEDDAGEGDGANSIARDRLVSNTYDPFAILNIEVVGRSIEDCLAHFCSAETLPDRIYRSPRGVGVKATKQFSIHSPPHVLLLHLKRFSSTGAKISKTVAYSPLLDLTPFCDDDFCDSYAFDDMSTTTIPSSASASSNFDSKSPKKVFGKTIAGNGGASLGGNGRRRILYTLNAIVIHEGGSIQYGHYYSVVRAKNGTWLVCDDSRVETCSEQRAMQCQAYMLFYSRVPEPETNKTRQSDRSAPAAPVRTAGGAREWKGVGVGGLLDTLSGHKSSDNSTSLAHSSTLRGESNAARRSLATGSRKSSGGSGPSNELYGKELSEEEVAAAVAAAASKRSSTRKSEGSDAVADVHNSGMDDHEDDDDEGPYPIRPSRGSILLPTKSTMEPNHPTIAASSESRTRKSQRLSTFDESAAPQRPSQQRPSHAQSLMKSMYGGIASSLARSQPSGTGDPSREPSEVAGKSAAGKLERRHAKEEVEGEEEGEREEEEERSGKPARKVSKVGTEALQALQEYDRENETLRTVVRSKHAPRFRQHVRDEAWEAEMDRGRIKKMRTEKYDENGNEIPYGQRNKRTESDGRNKFQESGIKFDSRGRRNA